jgi:hypothetical protein
MFLLFSQYCTVFTASHVGFFDMTAYFVYIQGSLGIVEFKFESDTGMKDFIGTPLSTTILLMSPASVRINIVELPS